MANRLSEADLDRIVAAMRPELRTPLADAIAQLRAERDEARAIARTLAHSYEHDSRPPARMVAVALTYPVFGAGTACAEQARMTAARGGRRNDPSFRF